MTGLDLADRIADIGRRRAVRSWLRRWLKPRLWTHRQYAPRPLNLADLGTQSAAAPPPFRFAIATPTRNGAAYLRAAIESVLGQGYARLQYLVQDASSSDGTADVLRTFDSDLSWISEHDHGQADAVNRALARAEADIMGWLNADDLYLPGCFSAVATAFAEHPDVDLVYGNRINIDADGMEVGRLVLPPDQPFAAAFLNLIPQETLFWRRRVWDALGGLDPTFMFAMDWDFTLRARDAGFHFLHLDRFLACFRSHPFQKTVQLRDVGIRESNALQKRQIGRVPGEIETLLRVSPYVAASWLSRLRTSHRDSRDVGARPS